MRITHKDLLAVLGRVRHITNTPEFKWTRSGTGNKCTVGAYSIHQGSAINGIAWALQLSVHDGGGTRDVVRGRTAAELYDRMQSWLDGYAEGARS
jgi:hypothetical protein